MFMVPTLRLISLVLFAISAYAQSGSVQGVVKYSNGAIAKNVTIQIEREEFKGVSKSVKTDKNGHYSCTGLPEATYRLSLIVGGHVADSADHVKVHAGAPTPINFAIKIP
jgi:hypothetical protein